MYEEEELEEVFQLDTFTFVPNNDVDKGQEEGGRAS